MKTIKEAKAGARILKTFMQEQGVKLPHSVYLEALARLEHKKNWATFLAEANEVEARIKTLNDIKNWPLFVFFFDEKEDEDGNYSEKCYMLPAGARLHDTGRITRWGGVFEDDAQEVPEGFVLDHRVVATEVWSHVPSVDKYGLPWYANEEMATKWFREELGCGALDSLDVAFMDTGDDSGSRYWFEAAVDPEYAKQLQQSADPVLEAYATAARDVIQTLGHSSVKDVMDQLQAKSVHPRHREMPAEFVLRAALNDSSFKVATPFERLSTMALLCELKRRAKAIYEVGMVAASQDTGASRTAPSFEEWVEEVDRNFDEGLTEATREEFRKYFDQGLSPIEAIYQDRADDGV